MGRAGEIAAFELDRRPGTAYGGKVCWDVSPPLRIAGQAIWLVSQCDLHLPLHDRLVHRPPTMGERCVLQGRPHELANAFKTKQAAARGVGNAYSVPMVFRMVFPLLLQIRVQRPQRLQRDALRELGEATRSRGRQGP